jgi:predicted CoA-binding protein
VSAPGAATVAPRENLQPVSALRAFLEPRTVAVIGASRTRGTPSGEVFHNLLFGGFAGPIYPVNPAASVVQSVAAYSSVEAIPGPVDLAVIAVPCERVLEIVEACGRKGVRALVVISAGFAEVGEEGRARQDELLRLSRAAGMRLIGPNCIGIINTDPAVRLNATFGPETPPPGRVGFLSQSGALGLAAVDHAASRGIGLRSSFPATEFPWSSSSLRAPRTRPPPRRNRWGARWPSRESLRDSSTRPKQASCVSTSAVPRRSMPRPTRWLPRCPPVGARRRRSWCNAWRRAGSR